MKVSKFMNFPDDKPFHSSEYAKTAHGDQLGATSAQSFSERQRIEQRRSSVQRYSDSMVARRDHSNFNQTNKNNYIDIVKPSVSRKKIRERQQFNSSRNSFESRRLNGSQSQRFREPPTRGYNPYQ